MSVHDYTDSDGKIIGWRICYREAGRQREQKVLKRDGWTKTQAKHRDAEIRKAKAEGLPVRKTRATVGDIRRRWDSDHVDGLRKRTQQSYRDLWRIHLEPSLGHLPAASVDRARVRKLIADLRKANVGPRTVNASLDVLRMVYNYAIDDLELPLVNPVARMKKARPKHQARKHTHVSTAQVRAIVAGARNHRDAVMILAIWLVGYRISELVAAERDDFNTDQIAVRISRSRDVDGTVATITKAARPDEVTLHAELERALDAWWQDEDWKRPAWRKLKLAFPGERGQMMDPKNWRNRNLYPAIRNAAAAAQERVDEAKAAGLQPSSDDLTIAGMVPGRNGITAHDLRAAYGSLVRSVSSDVMESRDEMRHESVELTIDTYGTRSPDARRKLRDAVEAATKADATPV